MSVESLDHAARQRDAWRVAAKVPDPEVPCVTVADLGILRDVSVDASGTVTATLTPTYSGCPATAMIEATVASALHEAGYTTARVETRLSPAWTTDWISAEGREKLRAYGIAPPVADTPDPNALFATPCVACPRCASTATEQIAAFGSTPCKAQYRCTACHEPFDYFKCHRQFG